VFLGLVGGLALALTIGLLLSVPRRLLELVREEREARHEAQEGADAARALAHVRDAVLLLDAEGAVRYANPAANSLLANADVGGCSRTSGTATSQWRGLVRCPWTAGSGG
jgi:hypothetical protein